MALPAGRLGVAIGLTSCLGTCAAVAQTAEIHLLWDDGEVAAEDVSLDGAVVIGSAREAPGGRSRWFRWTVAGGLERVGASEGLEDAAMGMSGDGSVLVGRSNTIAHLWSDARGPVSLGPLDQEHPWTVAVAASLDGQVVVGEARGGSAQPQAWIWREATGMVGLGSLAGPDGRSSAYDVTSDGLTVVGLVQDSLGFRPGRWRGDTGWEVLENAPDWSPQAWVSATSSDGGVMVGGISAMGGVAWAFRWVGSTNAFEVLEQDLTEGDYFAADVTDDGHRVVGHVQWDGNSGRAAVWDEGSNARLLSDVLENDHGVDLQHWTLLNANAVSRDGRVIAGEARFTGFNSMVSYVAIFAPACVADFNADGATNTLDVLAFLNAWAAGDESADVNDDGEVNTLDVLQFLNQWNAGC